MCVCVGVAVREEIKVVLFGRECNEGDGNGIFGKAGRGGFYVLSCAVVCG